LIPADLFYFFFIFEDDQWEHTPTGQLKWSTGNGKQHSLGAFAINCYRKKCQIVLDKSKTV